MVDIFSIVTFIRKKGAFGNGKKTVCISQNIQGDSGIKSNKRSIDDSFICKGKNLCPHDAREDGMIEMNQETVKCPIRWKRPGNIKTAVMSNEKVVIQIINKIGNHGKTFPFHNNKSTNHSMVGKFFSPCDRVFLNGRKVKIQEEGIIKLSHWLRCKKTNVF